MTHRTIIRLLAAAAAGALTFVSAALAQDNAQPPWGMANGDLFGRARSDQIPALFGTGTGAMEANRVNPQSFGADRPGGWGSIVFDADGNLYWRTTLGNNKLTSFSPAGTWRWNAKTSGGADYVFGTGWNSTSPIVGEQRVYGLGARGKEGIAAFDKSNGAFVWERLLPAESWDDNEQITPVLYDGKLYVVGEFEDAVMGTAAGVHVYQVDADDGALDWASTVPLGPTAFPMQGTMALVPNVFGEGEHGLYFNTSPIGYDDAQGPEMYAIKLTATGASKAWTSEGGKAQRSHVIYNPNAPGGPRLYTHTFTDYGAEFYSYDPVTGAMMENQNAVNAGHGYYDVGALDWDETRVITGGFDGRVVVYSDDGGGSTTDTVYDYTNWWGEYRVLGQLLRDKAGNSVLVSGTNSRCGDGLGSARAVVLNISDALVAEDGPIYIDDIEVIEVTAGTSMVFSEDFESLSPGPIAGQGGWLDDLAGPCGGKPAEVVPDPLGGGQGQVVSVDATGYGEFPCWGGIFHDFADVTAGTGEVVIRWKQYRPDLTDNVWPYFGDAVNDFNEGWTLAWDQTLAYFPYHFADAGGSTVTQTAGVWQTVTITYSNLEDPNPAARMVKVDIDGTTGTPVSQTLGFSTTEAIRGWGVQIEGTTITTGSTTNIPMLEHDTGVCADHGFTLRGGPLVGPSGWLYYFDGVTRELVALKPVNMKADANCDDALDGDDVPAFVLGVISGQAAWEAEYTCDFLAACDANNDGDVNSADVATFVMCLLAG